MDHAINPRKVRRIKIIESDDEFEFDSESDDEIGEF